MKRVMRCHDFRSRQGVRRRRYREYRQGAGRSRGRKVVPALRVAAKIAAYVVGRLHRILDTLIGVLLVIDNFGSQRTRVSSCYALLFSIAARVVRARTSRARATAPRLRRKFSAIRAVSLRPGFDSQRRGRIGKLVRIVCTRRKMAREQLADLTDAGNDALFVPTECWDLVREGAVKLLTG